MIFALFIGLKDIVDFNPIWHEDVEGYVALLWHCAAVGLVSTLLQVVFAVDSSSDMANVVTRKSFFTNPYGLPSNIYLAILFGLSLLSTVVAVATNMKLYVGVWVLSDYIWQCVIASGYVGLSFAGTCKLHTVWEMDDAITKEYCTQRSRNGGIGALV
jgi:hypothetical protein